MCRARKPGAARKSGTFLAWVNMVVLGEDVFCPARRASPGRFLPGSIWLYWGKMFFVYNGVSEDAG